jgi:hypothetical protein
MGMFNFFKSRRERESAIPSADAAEIIGKLESNQAPVGQPIESPQAQPGIDLSAFGVPGGEGQPNIFQVMGMIKDAYSSGNIQVSQGQGQTIDLRGIADGQALREQILDAMKQHGIDPNGVSDGTQVNAADYEGLQQQIMQALTDHGVEVNPEQTQGLPEGWLKPGGEGSR